MNTVELLTPEQANPDNPEWHALRRDGITASEIGAVLGLSPWDSPFSLYWRKINDWRAEDTVDMSTGRRVEPVVADWWADAVGAPAGMTVRPAGLYAHEARRWQLATPDRLVRTWVRPGVGRLTSVLECKWTGSWDGWGEPGTDDIPVYYRAQVLWQCDVLGVDEGHLAVLGPGGFRAYGPIRRDERDLTVMRTAGRRLLSRVNAGDPPDVDEHTATLATIKRLHPGLVDEQTEISTETAAGYRRARALKQAATQLSARFEARLRAEMGANRTAVDAAGVKVATRSVYDVTRVDTVRLKADQPEMAAAYATTSTTDRITPARSKR